MMPKSGNRFPAYAKPASAGEGRSDKMMRKRESGKAMARRPRASDETLVELFLDMQAAERGAGENTLAA